MRILYLDCFLGFDASMLLGALIDAGANPQETEKKFAEKGVSVVLSVMTAERSSIVCKKAAVLANNTDDIAKIYAENEFIRKVFENFTPTDGTDALSALAVVYAVEQLDIEYIITSEVSLGEGIDGTVLSILEQAGIEVLPSDGSNKNMQPADAFFLTCIANESGPRPPMEIIAVGYGAGGTNPDEPNIINAVIGQFEGDSLFEAEEKEELSAYL